MKATVYNTLDEVRAGPRGSISYYKDRQDVIVGMFQKCPGCDSVSAMDFKPRPSPSWNWDGNQESPTLTPSVFHKSGCGWHGYLTKGEWVK